MQPDHRPQWKPLADKVRVLDKLSDVEGEVFDRHMNRMRYEANPLTYQPAATCRRIDPYAEHHAVRLPVIGGDFIFTMSDKSSLSDEDHAQNPDLCGILHFKKFLHDGA